MAIVDIIGENWTPIIGEEFQKPYMQRLSKWLSEKRISKTIYPDKEDTFKALKLCPFGQIKVVILGKEPYYQGNADGLAFSYKNGERKGQGIQALDVILDEIERDCYNGFNVNKHFELDYLAKQGVLLLNSVLTVYRGEPSSHIGREFGWEFFTSKIINEVLKDKNPKVFLLWGKDAQYIFDSAMLRVPYESYHNHLIIRGYHPAYDLHKRDVVGNIVVSYPDGFSGCRHFSKTNDFLLKNGLAPIEWLDIHEPFNNEKLFKDKVEGGQVIGEHGYPKNWDDLEKI